MCAKFFYMLISSTTKISFDCNSYWRWRIPTSNFSTWISSFELVLFSAYSTCGFSWFHCHCTSG